MEYMTDKWEHGLYSSYTNFGCRCDACAEAGAQYRDKYRKENMPDGVHGTYSGYSTWKCRCRFCKMAGKQHRDSKKTGVVPAGKEHGVNGRRVYGCSCEVCVTASREYSQRARQRKLKGTGATVRSTGDRSEVRWDGKLIGWATVGPGGYTMHDSEGVEIGLFPVLRYEFVGGIVGHARETGEIE